MFVVIYNDPSTGLMPVKFNKKNEAIEYAEGCINHLDLNEDEIIIVSGSKMDAFNLSTTKTVSLFKIPENEMTPDLSMLETIDEDD